jgi:Zn-dependent protease
MPSTIPLGRFGPLTIRLNYSWLPGALLALWWCGLIWLPAHYPDWRGVYYWIVATAVILVYLLSVIVHELAHTVLAGLGRHPIQLYPFGAAQPFRARPVEPGRLFLAALAGIAVNLALGWGMLLVAGRIDASAGLGAGLVALLTLAGWMNIGLGLLNAVPGIPFDGGWALNAAVTGFLGERETGLHLARFLGQVAALVLVLLGAWRGLTTDAWLQALGLVLLGVLAREAAALGRQRGLVRVALEQLHARDFMTATPPGDAVPESASVAEMALAHAHYPPLRPLPVVDEQGALVGLISLAAADTLLQGTWPTVPVRALMTPLAEIRQRLAPDSPLTEALRIAQERQAGPQEDAPIPVVQDGRLVGSLDPAHLLAFEQVGQEIGIEEALAGPPPRRGLLRRLGTLLPAVFVLAVMAILGHAALQTNAAGLDDSTPGHITFSAENPSAGGITGLDLDTISVQIAGTRAITQAAILLDGIALPTEVQGTSPLTQTATATLDQGLTQGVHHVSVTAVSGKGLPQSTTWQFRVVARAGGSAAPALPPRSLDVVRYQPALAGRVPADTAGLPLRVEVEGANPPAQAQISLDGQALDTTVTAVEGAPNRYLVVAGLPAVAAGMHRMQVDLVASDGHFYSSAWGFTALTPDAGHAYFAQTGYFVAQPFLDYWWAHGGLALFGYPISDVLQETTGSGETYTAQYFERARFELHAATGDKVILGRVGALLHTPEPGVTPVAGAQFFPQTGHNLQGALRRFWEQHGSLAQFGYPISEAHPETSPADGRDYTVQYFERARLELHPEHAGTPFEVEVGQLGRQLYQAKYGP